MPPLSSFQCMLLSTAAHLNVCCYQLQRISMYAAINCSAFECMLLSSTAAHFNVCYYQLQLSSMYAAINCSSVQCMLLSTAARFNVCCSHQLQFISVCSDCSSNAPIHPTLTPIRTHPGTMDRADHKVIAAERYEEQLATATVKEKKERKRGRGRSTAIKRFLRKSTNVRDEKREKILNAMKERKEKKEEQKRHDDGSVPKMLARFKA